MFWHIDADVISIAIMLILCVCNWKLPPQAKGAWSETQNRRFTRCLEVGIGIAGIDVAASVIMEVPAAPWLYHLLMTAYFLCIQLVIVEWFLYVLTILYRDDERGRKSVAHATLAAYALYGAFCCANPWTGLIYSLSEGNAYSRGPLFSVTYVLFALFTAAMFLLILLRWKRIPGGFPSGVLLLTPIIIGIGIAVQLSVPGWLFIVPSYMICLVLAFLFLQTMRVRSSERLVSDLARIAETDKLTGLYNRVGMEAMVRHTLENARGTGVVVLIADVDDLKSVNDTMGHAEGDRCIRLVGEQLKKRFRSSDTVVRYGGDEFLAFYTGSFSQAQINATLRRLVDELGALRVGERDDVPVHASIGAAYGVVGRDSFEALCVQADRALYYVKRNGKNGCALYRPEMEN